MLRKIADAGLIVGLLNRNDQYHEWALSVFEKETPPFYTCDAVIAEAGWRTGRPDRVVQMVLDGDLIVAFSLGSEIARIHELLIKYPQMDVADGCLVRMSELQPDSRIWTVDRADFQIYRRFGKQAIPAVFPV